MTSDQAKAASRGVSADMSPAALSRRLDILVELEEVSRLLAAARRVAGVRRVTGTKPAAAGGKLPARASGLSRQGPGALRER